MLKFDSSKCIHALRAELVIALEEIQREYLNEVQSHMQTAKGKDDVFDGEIQVLATYIASEIIGGPWAIIDSYGTGSAMDIDNPALEWYKQSNFWNPARSDGVIRGRPEGDYTNIFGEEVYSSGSMEGIIIEQPIGIIKPLAPSMAFQQALNWMLTTGRLQCVIDNIINFFDFNKFIAEK